MQELTMTDTQIKDQIRAHMEWDSRLSEDGVLVEVNDNEVILSGTVPTYEDRLFAKQDAQIVYGVEKVDNRLIVALPQGTRIPTDAELRVNIESLFKWSTHINDEDINVQVMNSHVTLEGSVDYFWKRFRAEQLTGQIRGVTDITNKIAIVPTESLGDEATAKDIMDALERHARINVEDINVVAEKGHVRLSGSVPDMDAYNAAYDIARFTFGVIDVENLLTIPLS